MQSIYHLALAGMDSCWIVKEKTICVYHLNYIVKNYYYLMHLYTLFNNRKIPDEPPGVKVFEDLIYDFKKHEILNLMTT